MPFSTQVYLLLKKKPNYTRKISALQWHLFQLKCEARHLLSFQVTTSVLVKLLFCINKGFSVCAHYLNSQQGRKVTIIHPLVW